MTDSPSATPAPAALSEAPDGTFDTVRVVLTDIDDTRTDDAVAGENCAFYFRDDSAQRKVVRRY